MNYNYKNLPPFKFFVLQNFPFIEEDFDAITNWQLFCKLGEEINRIITSVNLTGEQVENLTNAFNELKDYVDDYFENLDVQDEIDNKLDEMAEGGELAEIISQYLTTQAILAFNTNNELKAAENLTDGSFARTYGKLTYNDGKGAFYKIREIVNTDVPDDDNIIALTNDNTLVAEKMPDYNINQLNTQITNVNNRIDNLNDKSWIFIGDSYSQGYSPDGNTTSWSSLLKSKMGLDNTNCIITDHGGSGFANATYPYYDLINDLTSSNTVTDILIAGGYNDLTYSKTSIINAMVSCNTLISTKFPNAKVHIAFIAGTTTEYHGDIYLRKSYYIEGCNYLGWDYLDNLDYILYYSNRLASDGIHPNQDGQNKLAEGLFTALKYGFNYTAFNDLTLDISESTYLTGNNIPLHLFSNNNISYLTNYEGNKYLNSTGFEMGNNANVKLGKITQLGIIGSKYYTNNMLPIGNIIIQNLGGTNQGYFEIPAKLYINKDGEVYIRTESSINDNHDNYNSFSSVRQIQLPQFTIVFPTDIY